MMYEKWQKQPLNVYKKIHMLKYQLKQRKHGPQKRKRWDQIPRRSKRPVNLSQPPSAHRHDHEKTKERYIIIVDKKYETHSSHLNIQWKNWRNKTRTIHFEKITLSEIYVNIFFRGIHCKAHVINLSNVWNHKFLKHLISFRLSIKFVLTYKQKVLFSQQFLIMNRFHIDRK